MNNSRRVLKDLVGESGIESLEKAIFKRGTSAVIDPMEFYFPLMVVPRAILSWLVQNIKPMKVGEVKEIPFPGKEDILINVQKQDVDQYRAEFIQGGRIIHAFEKQSLPAVSAHLMTAGEMYEDFGQEKKEDKKEEPKEKESKADVANAIIRMSNVSQDIPKDDSEHIKWMVSHANVKELTGVIGKLVDALVAREGARKSIEAELDKADQEESKEASQKVEESISPEEKAKQDEKNTKENPAIKEEGMDFKEMDKEKSKPSADQPKPKPEVAKEGVAAAEAEPKKDSAITKEEIPSKKIKDTEMDPSAAAKKPEILAKPYTSDAQRRWAHTAAGTKALGGKKAIEHWDKESKGKDLPEKVSKQDTSPVSPNTGVFKGELPSGAGAAKKPAMPKQALGAQGPSNNPAAAAAKQAQASARGQVKPPQTPAAPKVKNTSVKPAAVKAPAAKMPTMKSEGYFRNKLKNSKVTKNEKWYNVSEQELLKSVCEDCGKPNFVKSETGKPKFSPCACFAVMKKNEENDSVRGVQILSKDDGSYKIKFDKNADPESIKLFLLMLKGRLLLKKRFGL